MPILVLEWMPFSEYRPVAVFTIIQLYTCPGADVMTEYRPVAVFTIIQLYFCKL